MSANWRIGIDIGGTFTDFVAMNPDSGQVLLMKELTTPSNPALAIFSGLDKLSQRFGLSLTEASDIVHGTTLATNAIIERKGARTALITTAGFRDVVEIARERRYENYNLLVKMPVPLAPRELRWEVRERVGLEGEIIQPLDEADVEQIIENLRESNVGSVAITLINAFRNPAHERWLGERIARAFPQLPISLSSDVDPQVREFERTSTTLVNAYVRPTMERYLTSLDDQLKQKAFTGELHVMLSSGGIISSRTAAEYPSRIIESGPAGGIAAAAYYSRLRGEKNVVAFDMGGTTAKICLIEDGAPSKVTEAEVGREKWHLHGSGFPLRVPMIEMIEIGTGGGSIAAIDELGLLKVGPQSAGADPGPVCYGLGGIRPTMTDANLVLGYLDTGYFLGGEMKLDRDRAVESIRTSVAEPLGLTVQEAAWGIHEIATENMANAARLHAVSRGRDPAGYALLAFGGAGALHAHRLAAKLGMSRLICPAGAGVMSALGFLVAPVSYEVARGYRTLLSNINWPAVHKMFDEMRTQVVSFLADAGVRENAIQFEPSALASYVGQGYEVEVRLPDEALDGSDGQAIRQAFEKQYRALYGQINDNFEIQVLTWRLTGAGPSPEVKILVDDGVREQDASQAYKGTRKIYSNKGREYEDWAVYDRYRLTPGMSFTGPAVVEERESTVIVPPGAHVTIDNQMSLVAVLPGGE